MEIRGPSEIVRLLVQLHAEPRQLGAQRRADGGGVLADAGGEDESIQPAEHGRVGAGVLGHRVDEILHRRDRARIRALLQHPHVVADAG